MVTAAMKVKDACSLGKSWDQARQHIKKQRHYFATEVHLVKAMVFPVVMYGCESWTIKKAESWRIDAFELWCWRRLLRVPWMAWRSSQIIGWTDAEAETLILWPLYMQNWLIWKDPNAGNDLRQEKGSTEDESWMISPTRWTWVWVSSRSWWWTGKPGTLQAMG